MWNRPASLHWIADFLWGVAALMACYALALLAIQWPLLPIRELVVRGAVQHTQAEDFADQVAEALHGGFLDTRLGVVREKARSLPWVREARVRRVWPDHIELEIEEHEVLARWGDQSLVNTRGERFAANYSGALPVFIGPEEKMTEISEVFRGFSRIIAPTGETIHQLTLDNRGAWSLRLSSGLSVKVGREDIEDRLRRFAQVYARTIGRIALPVSQVDLRYPNGFAVRLPQVLHLAGQKNG